MVTLSSIACLCAHQSLSLVTSLRSQGVCPAPTGSFSSSCFPQSLLSQVTVICTDIRPWAPEARARGCGQEQVYRHGHPLQGWGRSTGPGCLHITIVLSMATSPEHWKGCRPQCDWILMPAVWAWTTGS